MKDSLSLLTVFISGLFGLLVAYVTSRLTNHKENRRYQQELQEKASQQTKDRYVRIIKAINQSVACVRRGEDRSVLSEQFSELAAETTLMEDEAFILKFDEVDSALAAWSMKHYLASPKKMPGLDMTIVSTMDSQHKPDAIKLHEEFNALMTEFIAMMKSKVSLPKAR